MQEGWQPRDPPAPVLLLHEASIKIDPSTPEPVVMAKVDRFGTDVLHAVLTRDPLPGVNGLDPRWHLSVSAQRSVPKWNELAAACHELRPGVPFVIGVPPRSQWINVNDHVLHCLQTNDATLLDQWRWEGRGDRPT
jgi:hypothetical protein